ncbi:MAG: flagellar basal body rod C-terminal domain-containing protein [Sulfuricurvum sp.]
MINSNVSSLVSQQTYLNNSAVNVANVNTDGYVPRETVINSSGNGTVEAKTSLATNTGSTLSQTNLTKEITDQITVQKVSEANVTAIRTQDQMLGSLLDIRG